MTLIAAAQSCAHPADLPRNLDDHLRLIGAWERAGQPDAARPHVLKVLQVRPADLLALLKLAEIEQRRGAEGDARRIYRRLTAEQFIDAVWTLTGSAPGKIEAGVNRKAPPKVVEVSDTSVPTKPQWIWSAAGNEVGGDACGTASHCPAHVTMAGIVV